MLEFHWFVDPRGYRWEDVEILSPPKTAPTKTVPKPPYLTAGPMIQLQLPYQPLRGLTGVFRTFAETEPTKAGIGVFANKYGLLGGDITLTLSFPEPTLKSPTRIEPGHGEPFSTWAFEILYMRQLVRLWDMANARDVHGLSQYIRWHKEEDGILYDSNPDLEEEIDLRFELKILHSGEEAKTPILHVRHWIATPGRWSELLDRFRYGDVIQPALYYVQRIVNEKLKGHVSARLLWAPDRTKLDLCFVPESLRDALWLQFAHAIACNIDHRPCDECHTWFELSPKVARTDKRYCSPICRNRAYQHRIAKAQQLHADSVSVENIAQQLKTDIKTVQRWLAKHLPQTGKRRRGRPRKQLTTS